MGTVALKHESNYFQWFDSNLEPYVHFVPVKRDFSDLHEQIIWLKDNDDIAQEIARNGIEFVKRHFSDEAMEEYIVDLFKEYESIYNQENNDEPSYAQQEEELQAQQEEELPKSAIDN